MSSTLKPESSQELMRFVEIMDRRASESFNQRDRAYWYWFVAQWIVLLAGFFGAILPQVFPRITTRDITGRS